MPRSTLREQKHVFRIIAPSSSFERELFDQGLAQLSAHGITCRYDDRLFEKDDYLAGSKENRLREITDALKDTEATALMAARGGYGLAQVMPQLIKLRKPTKPKLLIGFSDFTHMHLLAAKWNFPSLYSPMAANKSFVTMPEALRERWLQLLGPHYKKIDYSFTLQPYSHQKSGVFKGTLVGGCLRTLAESVGTAWMPRFKNPTILFLEDVNEAAYSLDRCWWQLKNAGCLKNVKAVLWGQMENCHDVPVAFRKIPTYDSFPHFHGIAVGHGDVSDSLRLNVRVSLTISGTEARLRYL